MSLFMILKIILRFSCFLRNNVKRIISGKLTMTGKGSEGRYNVKYDNFPIAYDTSLVVLDSDYKNYAVIWSCSNIGPFARTESAWVS